MNELLFDLLFARHIILDEQQPVIENLTES